MKCQTFINCFARKERDILESKFNCVTCKEGKKLGTNFPGRPGPLAKIKNERKNGGKKSAKRNGGT